MTSPVLAIRAKSVLTLAGESPARGVQLFAALKKIDNALLLVREGLLEDVRPWAHAVCPRERRCATWAPVCLAPACVNAHVPSGALASGRAHALGQGLHALA